MEAGRGQASGHGVPEGALRPGELVLRWWSAPHGRGILSNFRFLLLSHPHPLHREVVWERNLETIQSLEVSENEAGTVSTAFVQNTLYPQSGRTRYDPTDSTAVFDPRYVLLLDGITVLVGSPDGLGEIQAAIDAARERRCMDLFGRVLPYRPGA